MGGSEKDSRASGLDSEYWLAASARIVENWDWRLGSSLVVAMVTGHDGVFLETLTLKSSTGSEREASN